MTNNHAGYIPPHNFEAEQSVLGGLMIRSSAYHDLSLSEPDFYSRPHQIVFGAISSLVSAKHPVDLMTVSNRIEGDGLLGDIGGMAYLIEIAKNTPSASNIETYGAIVRQASERRFAVSKLYDCVAAMMDPGYSSCDDRFATMGSMISEIDAKRSGGVSGIASPASDIVIEWCDEMERRLTRKPGELAGFATGIPSLDELLYPGGISQTALICIGARPKMGKAQPLNARILLADGSWVEMGKIQVGDMVASQDGATSKVIGIFPQGIKDVYAVTFSDGREVECCADHLWQINSSRLPAGTAVVDTTELMRLTGLVRYKSRISVPSVSGDFGSVTDIGIDPWLLGVLLGDGNLTNATPLLTNSEPYIVDRAAGSLCGKDELRRRGKSINYSIVGCGTRSALEELGVYGKLSHEKFIPREVYSASRAIREGVLSGLLETDGWVEGKNVIRFSSASEQLTQDVAELVRSLGGTARIKTKATTAYSYKGDKRLGLPAHLLCIRLPNVEIIKSPRLADRLFANRKTPAPIITGVRLVRRAECQCIAVSHENHLYVTDGYIATHNTTLMAAMLNHVALNKRLPLVGFSLEMTKRELFEVMVSQASGVSGQALKSMQDQSKMDQAYAVAAELGNSKLYLADQPGMGLHQIVRESRRLRRELGQLGVIAVDYLTLMKAEKAERNDLAYGAITKGLKELAKEMGCPVILLTQLNRGLESRADKRPMPSDSRDTGQIEQDCDIWIGCYRDEVYHEDSPTRGLMELLVRIHRGGKTGTAYCGFHEGVITSISQQEVASKVHMAEMERSRDNKSKGGWDG